MQHYRDLTPSVPYILDYHVLASTYDEPLLARSATAWMGRHPCRDLKGEAGRASRRSTSATPTRSMADNHVVYKNGAKEIAHLNGCSITFMAKPDHTWIGSSCHIHSSLWRERESAFAGESDVFRQYLAGQIACARELALFFAPNINSYKRFAAGSLGADDARVGHDNRTCGFRIVGSGPRCGSRPHPGRRRQPVSRVRGAIAAGLYGIEHELELAGSARGERVRLGRRSGSRRRCARRSRRSKAGRWRAQRSATRSSTTT